MTRSWNYLSPAAVFISVWCLLTGTANAEVAVTYHQANVPVDSKSVVVGGALKVTLGNEPFLVAEDEAGRRVALRLLSNPALQSRVTPDLLGNIFRQAVEKADSEVAKAALLLVLGGGDFSSFDQRHVWEELAASEFGRGLLRDTLLSAERIEGLDNRVCYGVSAVGDKVAPSDPAWSNLLKRVSPVCARLAVERAARNVYRLADPRKIEAEYRRDLTGFVLSGEVSQGEAGLKQVNQLGIGPALVDLAVALEDGDSIGFNQALEVIKTEGRLAARSANIIDDYNSSELSDRFVQLALQRGKLSSAFEHIFSIPFEKRTSKTHRFVVEALRQVEASSGSALFFHDSFIREIRRYVEKDSEIEGEYQNAANRIVRFYISQGQVAPALEIERKLNLRLPLIIWLRLRLAEMWIPLLGVVAVGISIGCVFFLRGLKHRLEKDHSNGKEALNHLSHEYLEALKFFDLSPEVGVADIKEAYRTAVKEHHPDTKINPTVDDHTFFIRVTSEYEKLMALHKERE